MAESRGGPDPPRSIGAGLVFAERTVQPVVGDSEPGAKLANPRLGVDLEVPARAVRPIRPALRIEQRLEPAKGGVAKTQLPRDHVGRRRFENTLASSVHDMPVNPGLTDRPRRAPRQRRRSRHRFIRTRGPGAQTAERPPVAPAGRCLFPAGRPDNVGGRDRVRF